MTIPLFRNRHLLLSPDRLVSGCPGFDPDSYRPVSGCPGFDYLAFGCPGSGYPDFLYPGFGNPGSGSGCPYSDCPGFVYLFAPA